MRRSKFKPVLESMELRLTLSDVTFVPKPPVAAPGYTLPGEPVKRPREPVDTTGCDSPNMIDFSNTAIPDYFPYYTDQPIQPFNTGYTY